MKHGFIPSAQMEGSPKYIKIRHTGK